MRAKENTECKMERNREKKKEGKKGKAVGKRKIMKRRGKKLKRCRHEES